ncbi:MAG: Cof-type HAD-IIB family hydrolase [Alistipes sp.]|nr:Cof-type HAD-IIB family hydrolase [Alistipes sp.]
MIRALFFDVDGTLVSFATHRVPDSARRALEEAHARGVLVFIATGRTFADLGVIAGLPCDGIVSLNGAECLLPDGGRIADTPVPPDEFERALAVAQEFGFPVMLEMNEGIFVDRLTPEVVEFARQVDLSVPVEADLRELFERHSCRQLCFFVDPLLEPRVMARVPGLAASRWSPLFVDVNVRGVNKAAGAGIFASRFGFSMAEAMAFGDGGNDVPLLRAAGVGVAMGNACDEARQAADYVTASVDDDGVRKALVHFGVIGRGNRT